MFSLKIGVSKFIKTNNSDESLKPIFLELILIVTPPLLKP